ncbi:hypothetical protein SAMN04487967_1091 [Natronorubrum sediminis]|uniref:Small CPxCG-related zinc finger protein n=1 Tax=Natronorubrum sediminis TaxID=640943 RepID=A0A1H6FT01_9EURY|nr:DUF6276 family protein [Natronorubrum sediminis]SEH13013.1 hypothetical protein SAMN04487967_1091 [Natronorubrum sediminis]
MTCPTCSSPTVAVEVPESYREYAPERSATVAICTHCLTVESAEGGDPDPNFTAISDALPSNADAAIPLVLAIDRCDSLVTNRSAIEELLEAVEREGTDPLLVWDRLSRDPELEPTVDLERRRHQLEQLLY